jgi:hypothetical protein
MIHDVVYRWFDELLVVSDKDNNSPHMELNELFAKTRQKFLGVCFQRLIEQKSI